MATTYEAGLVLVTHHFKHAAMTREAVVTFAFNDVTSTTAQQSADNLQALAADNFDNYLDSSAQLMRTTTLKGNGSTSFTVGTSTALPRTGTNPISGAPPNTAVLVQKRTALGGRKGRGRVYFPWSLNESEVDETGKIGVTYVSGFQNSMDAYLFGYGGAMVIANRLYDLPWTNPARQLLAVTKGAVVTALIVSNMAATQRRRMPRT